MTQRFAPLVLVAMLACDGATRDASLAAVSSSNAGISVLLVTVDTLRADHLSTYGYPRVTSPNIDALASRGVAFDIAFTYWPKTRGSFASLFTGVYASQHGLTVRERDLPEFNQTLAETFRDAGYRTAAALDNGNLDAALGFAQGFDTYEQTWQVEGSDELSRTEAITRFGESYLGASDDERPFFLWLHYVNPHTPYEPTDEALARFRGDGIIPRGPELARVTGYHGGVNKKHVAVDGENYWGDYIDRYDAEIFISDEHLGRVLKALSESEHASTTLVVFTSDHGESLGEHDYYFDHGFDLFNPSLRIPLILSFPGMLPAGERVSGAVSSLDVFPTILDVAQVSYPSGLEGKSVLPLVRGTTNRLHEQVFFQNDRHQMAISNGRLKLVHYPDDRFELYDMYRDPTEDVDRYAGSEPIIEPFKAELSSFRTQTVAWQQATTARREAEGAAAVDDSELSEKTRRMLCDLGYIDCEK
ncbi:MAG: sulfatase-like hydrolase/transferase [Acidobacteriota bacterium]|nr:MAG: sulfatase-like hydrolase/transferase [Acidobacteriota bacterium]